MNNLLHHYKRILEKRKWENPSEQAFSNQILESEKRRVTILAGIGIFFLIVFTASNLLVDHEFHNIFKKKFPFYAVTIFFVFIILFDIALRFFFDFLIKIEIKPLLFMRYVNAFVEMSFPTVAIVFVSDYIHPVYVLNSPVLLVYFLFIILAALRLDFKLCVFTGAIAALEYSAIAVYLIQNAETKGIGEIFFIHQRYVGMSGFFLLGGIVTGFVTLALKKLTKNVISTERKLVSLEQELEIARKIQTSILPHNLPPMPKVKISTRYIPMVNVGGDFFDFHILNDNEMGALIADVTGHGVGAALIASMIKIAFSLQKSHANDPARVLSNMNQILMDKGDNQIVSAGYVYLNLNDGVIFSGNAGHWPLLILKARDSQIVEVKAPGAVIGWFLQNNFQSSNNKIENGDKICLYTDGIIEEKNKNGEMFGYERFQNLLKKNHSLPVDDLVQVIEKSLSQWGGGKPGFDDDISMVFLEIRSQ
jgi:hypothetical protein